MNEFSRTELLLGKENMEKLQHCHIAVFGIGGVGGYVVEALARCGIGYFDLIDNDVVSLSNINRQIIALHSTIGQLKVDVMKERILDMNPNCIVHTSTCFFLPETKDQFDFSQYDYIVDCIDTVSGKIEIILEAQRNNVPVISSMGTGNKMDPSQLEITDIYKTSMCPLAKVMRKELKKRGVKHCKVLYSKEKPIKPVMNEDILNELSKGKRSIPASNSFVPTSAGLLIASEVIKDLTEEENK